MGLGIVVLIGTILIGERIGDRSLGTPLDDTQNLVPVIAITPAPNASAKPYGPDWDSSYALSSAPDPGFPHPPVPAQPVPPPPPAPPPAPTPGFRPIRCPRPLRPRPGPPPPSTWDRPSIRTFRSGARPRSRARPRPRRPKPRLRPHRARPARNPRPRPPNQPPPLSPARAVPRRPAALGEGLLLLPLDGPGRIET